MEQDTSQSLAPEIIDVVPHAQHVQDEWTPVIGSETLTLLAALKIPEESKAALRDEAVAILARSLPPKGPEDNRTGLVIGYVQSGKTMSFTTVAALAHDNGFPLVVVITGVSDPLFAQSTERLQSDLRLNDREDRKWLFLQNPSPRSNDGRAMAARLTDWTDPTVPENERQTVLITVMKNHRHLENLTQVLSSLKLAGIVALVIDDEADQAGLNTLVKQGDQSTTYRRLVRMRQCLPRHTFLQYTATPQAPLLINIIDMLSPSFAEVLTPGSEYVGARDFFIESRYLAQPIPTGEIQSAGRLLQEPPDSLLQAMRIFFLGVAAGLLLDGGTGNRSMLVHPSQKTRGHKLYFHWVSRIKSAWEDTLQLPENDPDRRELQEDFALTYQDLARTVDGLPALEQLTQRLPHTIRRTWVEEVNATRGKTPLINWNAAYSYILIGGQAMDRGFTVRGLTVTYMPRGVGVANADTVQQRARFFGYKRRYIGYCRVFLETSVLGAYRQYVEHEEDIRRQLSEYGRSGKPLKEWKRAFFLTRNLKPTRDSVLDLDYMRDSFSDRWYAPKAPHDSEDATRNNWEAVSVLTSRLGFTPDSGHPDRTDNQRHKVIKNVSLRELYEGFLTQLRIPRQGDSQPFTGLLIQISNYLERYPEEECAVYLMSSGGSTWMTRKHKVNNEGEIENLFQGEYPVDPIEKRGTVYPGDRQLHDRDRVTVHIHRISVLDENRSSVIADNVPAVTVWVPRKMAADWLVQRKPGS